MELCHVSIIFNNVVLLLLLLFVVFKDVVMVHSGSGALLMSFEVLCEPGSAVLIPTPGFGLYKCHADALGVEARMYRLLVREGREGERERERENQYSHS